MEALVAPAAAEGSPVRIHAIGDEAIHRCLDIFEAHPVASPAHHTIEHLENFQPDDIARHRAGGRHRQRAATPHHPGSRRPGA